MAGPSNMVEHHDVSFPADGEFRGDATDELRALVKSELEPGERVLWAAGSIPRPIHLGVPFVFFGATAVLLLGIGLALLALGAAGRDPRADLVGPAWVCLFWGGVIALGVIWSWNNRRRSAARLAKVCYALTDRRAIVWIPAEKETATRVYNVHRGQFQGLVRVQRPDGTGDLEFALKSDVGYDFHWSPPAFQRIHDVRRVEQIIRLNLMANDGDA